MSNVRFWLGTPFSELSAEKALMRDFPGQGFSLVGRQEPKNCIGGLMLPMRSHCSLADPFRLSISEIKNGR